jgi:hypothetical protein
VEEKEKKKVHGPCRWTIKEEKFTGPRRWEKRGKESSPIHFGAKKRKESSPVQVMAGVLQRQALHFQASQLHQRFLVGQPTCPSFCAERRLCQLRPLRCPRGLFLLIPPKLPNLAKRSQRNLSLSKLITKRGRGRPASSNSSRELGVEEVAQQCRPVHYGTSDGCVSTMWMWIPHEGPSDEVEEEEPVTWAIHILATTFRRSLVQHSTTLHSMA